MKKTLIIALLAVLVLGVFTACNGDVNAELANKRTITLVIDDTHGYPNNGGWAFANGAKTYDLPIPSDCSKWGDLVGKSKIVVKNNAVSSGEEQTLTLVEYYGFALFDSDYVSGEFLFLSKSIDSVLLTDSIEIGAKYSLTLYAGN